MQDLGQNGPENEVNPLIDNGFMYTTDGWGTIYKIDARAGSRGTFAWIADPGVPHEGNTSRTRGIALWEDKVIANIPDGRVIAINRDTGEIVWQVPLGEGSPNVRNHALLKGVTLPERLGSPGSLGGALITKSGLVFIGGGDGYLYVFDLKTGKEISRAKVPYNNSANPMTYRTKSGKQFVVMATGVSDQNALVAFTLGQ
jgi:alcohol dehydrogenase (cytochrome c)